MGLSVHYKGEIDPEQIAPLCEELRDIAGSVGWEFIDIDDDEKGLRGIVLHPSADMESVAFLFDAEGRLHSLFDLLVGWKVDALLCVSVKTQFAGCSDHIWLCGLLRHIQRTYMPNLVVTDEGGYWETGDRQELQRRMEFLGRMIKDLGSALEQASMDTVLDKNDPDAIADFIQRVAENFRRRKSDGEE